MRFHWTQFGPLSGGESFGEQDSGGGQDAATDVLAQRTTCSGVRGRECGVPECQSEESQ